MLKRLSTLFLLVFAMAFTLTACAPAAEEPAPAEEEEMAEEEAPAEEEMAEEEMAEEEMAEEDLYTYSGPLKLFVMPVTRPYMPDAEGVAQAIAADLAAVGIETELVSLGDWAVYLDERANGNLDGLYFLGWTGDNGDPDNFLGYFFGQADSELPREGYYQNAEVAALLQQAQAEVDPAVRADLYIQAQAALDAEAARVWLVHNSPPVLLADYVDGYAPSPLGQEKFDTVVLNNGETTFTFAAQGDAVNLDNGLVTDGESFRVIYQGCEGLLDFAPGSSTPVPALATEWSTSDDLLTWTFTLQEGVTFHDGTPFNAEAVVFNYERWRNTDNEYRYPEQVYEYFEYMWGGFDADSNIASVTAIDENTVEFVFNSVTTVEANMAMVMFALHSPDAIMEYGEDYGTPDVGYVCTGPYEFVEWLPGESITLQQNANYWGEITGNVEEIVILPIVDPAARFAALQAGEINGYFGATPEDVEAAETNEALQVLRRGPLNNGYLAFNYRVKELRDPLVREAIALAINRQALADAFYGGSGIVATQWMPPGMLGTSEDFTGFPYDPDRARELLTEAGFADGLTTVHVYPVGEDGTVEVTD